MKLTRIVSLHFLLIKPTKRILSIRSKRRDEAIARSLVQTDRFVLMDSGFEAHELDVVYAGVVFEIVEHHFGVAMAAELWADVHAFEFAVVGVEFDSAAADGRAFDS